MVTIIRKGTAKSRIMQILNKIRSRNGIDAYKYCGVIRLKNDALLIQKQMRGEW